MLFKTPKTRKFQYSPSFYSEKQEQENRRPRISFRKHLKYTNKRRSFVGLLILLIIAILVLYNLSKIGHKVPEKVELENMEIVK